ncbi:6-phosphofructokinase [Synchytrium microbalum]|uniref:ATP-dependent 6-phosphofructokinase n=1 Tax=Synchytrium microbalum TaxID=1806994 RepID=A0A507C223_9FUNG|nr:6-phosphofructokinase [Synchytrium microbalum]TPX32006.1 6-phosphofructokinase [Synchytrium microbalum]
MAAPLTSISAFHLNLTAPSPELFKETWDFYASIGFRLANTASPSQVWLQLYGDPHSDLNGIAIKLSLVENSSDAFNIKSRQGKLAVDLASTAADLVDSAILTLVARSLKDVVTSLVKLQRPHAMISGPPKEPSYVSSPSSPTAHAARAHADGCVLTFDPLLNLIAFTTAAPPVAPSSYHGISLKAAPSSRTEPVVMTGANGIPSPANGLSVGLTPKKIGILTSGGDSSGMNAAVRSITRIALQKGCVPYAIFEGYQGLVDGGDKIKELTWNAVRGLMPMGGTVIGTARCAAFRTREGRLKAALNMILNGIDALIVIGGDGSLTGADMLRAEWGSLVNEVISKGLATESQCSSLREHLTIVGLVGSIDNDMCSTDITIGAVTSLHRICEAVDSLSSTALSHQRAFVVEVMGRHCGWLALMAAIAVGADWVFLPERPPPLDPAYGDDWETEFCEALRIQRELGNRKTLVIICEGAIDRQLKPIKPEYIKKVIDERLGLDTRVTTLGHVQRGGTPCAYDRYLATAQGVEAVEAVLRSTPTTPSPMIGMSQNKITSVSLMDAVKLTHEVSEAIARKDFSHAMELRDPDFTAAYDAYIEATLLASGPGARKTDLPLRIGIVHVGAPAGGMNPATRTAVRLCLNRGHTPLGIRDGFVGLARGDVQALSWKEVSSWAVAGGSELGTNRAHPKPSVNASLQIRPRGVEEWVELGVVAYQLQKHNIQALMIVGGFEAFTSLLTMVASRKEYPSLCIPMIHLPATVSNNVPGTDFSIGCDTALNAIVEACDRIKVSASASRRRVFVVEVQGGECGYLAVMGGLTTGAMNVYTPEEGISLSMLSTDVAHLCRRYREEEVAQTASEGRVVLVSEYAAADAFNTTVISNIFKHEGAGLFDSRTTVLGHLQQGGIPSPLDRTRATRLAVNCVDWIQERAALAVMTTRIGYPSVYANDSADAVVIGIRGAQTVYTPIMDLLSEVDIKRRRGNLTEWWAHYRDIIKVLSKYTFKEKEGVIGDAGEQLRKLG